MKRKFFLAVFILSLISLSIFGVFSANRLFKVRGFFVPDSAWTGGHPGKVTFDIGVTSSGYTTVIDEAWYLSGYFWIWNVGWSTFNHEDVSCRAQIICPEDITRNPNQLCPIYGCAWSKNAGWIALSGSLIDTTSTGVYYNPRTAKIEGFWWSRGLGWVPFYADINASTGSSQTWITVGGLRVNFLGKIAIVGNIAGTRIYDLPNQSVGYIFSSSNQTTIFNTIRKNLALLKRNIPDTTLEDPNSTFEFMIQKSGDYIFRNSWIWPLEKRTIVVVGHDIILDQDYINPSPTQPTALIALQDDNGNGWNVVITDKVKRIYSVIYAEWSIFSGEKTATWYIDSYINHGVWNIPTNQLYIRWLIISKNTIWWAQQSIPQCPIVLTNCTSDISQIYDLNFMRTYDPTESIQRSIPSPLWNDSRFDKAAIVIDYDQSILGDPPPWLLNISQ
jgi:hypothetical protein